MRSSSSTPVKYSKTPPYLDVVSAYRDDLGVVGKLRVSAFQRFFPRLRRRSPRRDTAPCQRTANYAYRVAVRSSSSTPVKYSKMAPYLDVVNAYRDDLGVVGKLRVSAFQWFFPRLRRRSPRRDMAPCQRTPNYAYRVAVRSSSSTLPTVLRPLDPRWW